MALRTDRLLCLALAAVVAGAAPSHAVDSRIEKAKQIRDEILEKRRRQPAGAAVRPDIEPVEDPFQASVTAARERVAAIELQIEEKRRQALALAGPRDALQAKSDALALQINAIQERNRTRVEAIYRSAKLGAGAAGWHPEPARSARLSRYLASIAADQQKKLEVVEVEHGSVIASLDRARAEDASAQNELRALDADRTEALAGLDRALADAGMPRARDTGLTPEEAEAEALAFERSAAPGAPPAGPTDSAAAVERAMALLQAKTGVRPVGEMAGAKPAGETAGVRPVGEAAGAKDAPAADAGAEGEGATGGDFAWPTGAGAPAVAGSGASTSEAEAKALAEAKAALEARRAAEEAEKAAMAEEEKLAAAARVAEAKVIAEAKAAAKAAEEKKAAEEAATKAAEEKAAAEALALAKAEAEEKKDAHGTARELEDGPAVLAPSSATAGQAAPPAAQPGGETQAEAEQPQPARRNLLSRMFGGDREADEFAASRGKLPPPVAGKVVANYGQQHKSGATYRGVILRAGHSAPIKAVAGGKVSFAGNVPGLGNTVIVSHGGRYHTVYARLGSLEVKEGQTVGSGTEVGTLPADDADMHFELRDQGKAIDPVPWLKGGLPGAAQ